MTWTFSRLRAFETCPKRYYHTHVAKDVPDPPGAEAQFGTSVHKALEDRLTTGQPITGVFACYDPYAEKVASLVKPGGVLHAEQKIALTRDLKPTDFFANDAWFRGVVDFIIQNGQLGIVGDWKTGKRKPADQQLELYAAAVAATRPDVEVIKTIFIWFKEKATDVAMLTRKQAEEVWDKFYPRVERIDEAVTNNNWPPKPSGLCRRYCPVRICPHCGT